MKIKAKIICVGMSMLGMTVFGGALKAEETLPLDFKEGDILSAELMNTIIERINNSTKGFQSVDELVGTWSCVNYAPADGTYPGSWGTSDHPYSLITTTSPGYYKADSSITFTKTGQQTVSISSTILLGGLETFVTGSPFPGPYNYVGVMVRGNSLFTDKVSGDGNFLNWPTSINFTKLSPRKMNMEAVMASSDAFSECIKANLPPIPAKGLSGTASGTSVSLSWTDQSSDETGFKVQTKTSVSGSWSTATTTAANATSASVTASSGNNWYRVLATNSNGDSITSNEILVEIQ